MSTESSSLIPVNLHEILSEPEQARIPWSASSPDLNVNLVVLDKGESIPAHRNTEVDVFVICLSGAGELVIDDAGHEVGPGSATLIPRGTKRQLRALTPRFAYLTCHRRRAELWPEAPSRLVDTEQQDQ